MTMADDQDSLTDFDKCVIEAEVRAELCLHTESYTYCLHGLAARQVFGHDLHHVRHKHTCMWLQESVIRGLVTDGAIEQAGPTALCEAELLAPWISTNEVGAEMSETTLKMNWLT